MLTLIGWSNLSTAQTPNWAWAKSAGGALVDQSYNISVDANGNVFMTGMFVSPTITFGSITLTNTGLSDIFLVKYDSNGNVLWAKSAIGSSEEISLCVCTDMSGNVFIGGGFSSPTITFDTITLNNVDTVLLYTDMFIAKYDENGNALWAKSAGGYRYEGARSISTDLNGNLYVTGIFDSPSISFDTTTIANSSPNHTDVYVAKYTANGSMMWVKSAGDNKWDESYCVSTDIFGNVYVTGSFSSSIITFGTTTLTNSGVWDVFVVKYDSVGNVLWAKNFGGTDFDDGYSLSADIYGYLYITGRFMSSQISFGTFNLTNSGFNDTFIVKCDSIGNVLWAKSSNSASNDYGKNITTDGVGNVYLAGFFSQSSITFGTTNLISNGGQDIFIVKYDSSGNVQWAKSLGGFGAEMSCGISIGGSSSIYIGGWFSSPTINFGSTTLNNAVGSGVGSNDVFIAKLSSTTVGLNEIKSHSDISIAPNPFTSETTITFSDEQRNTTIKIIDVIGKEIKSISFSGKQLVIDKGKMKPGIYLVQTIDENQNVVTKKIVIQ